MSAIPLTGGMHCFCGEPMQCVAHVPGSGIRGGMGLGYHFYCPRCSGPTQSGEKPLSVAYDRSQDILTIEGFRYTGALFRGFAGALPLDRWIKIVGRDDGVITVMAAPLGSRIAWEEA